MKPRSRPKTTDELLSANAERTEALRSQLRRLGVLYHVTRVVTQTHDPEEALQATLDEVMTATGATSGSIALVDPVSGDLLLYFELGRDEGWYVDEWCYEDVYRSYSWYALCTMSGLAFTCRYTDTSDSLSEFEDVAVTGEFAADFNSGALLFTPCPDSDDEPCTLAGEIQR